MYEESGYYNPITTIQEEVATSGNIVAPSMEEEITYNHNHNHQGPFLSKGEQEEEEGADASAAMDIHHLQHRDHENHDNYDHHLANFQYTQLPQDSSTNLVIPPYDWGTLQDMPNNDNMINHQLDQQLHDNNILPSEPQCPALAPDVISLLRVPGSSTSSFFNTTSFVDQQPPLVGSDTPSSMSSMLYDPVFHLNLPPQPPFFKDLFQSLPIPTPPYFMAPSGGGGGSSLFGNLGEDDQREGMIGCLYQDEDISNVGQKFDGGVFEFARDMACVNKRRRGGGKASKPFTTERDRRVNMNERFTALRKLIPSPTKGDRASIVADAIDYIKELLRTVDELKLLVEKKRHRMGKGGMSNRHKLNEEGREDLENSDIKQPPIPGEQETDPSFMNGSVRTSWLQRKSKDTEVDVRVVDDEVTIKLVWRKKISCLLLFVSKALDELQLDLHHVAGGHIGDYCCFLFNTKIYEGSSVYASAIANKLIAVVDGQSAATQTAANCY